MDKNKNRTDLLAAGRKKLQQYRQKKDGKGNKSSSKANKPDRDMATGDSSSIATSSPEEVSGTELVELSSQASTDTSVSTNADMATLDLSSTSNIPIEVSKVDVSVKDSVRNEDIQSSNIDDVIPVVSPPKIINNDGKHESGFVGLKAVLDDDYDNKEGEMIAVHVEDEDQEDNRTSLIDVEVDDKREFTNSGIEHSASGIPTSSDHEPGIGDSGDTNVDVHSASGLQSSDLELRIGDSGDANTDAHSVSGFPPSFIHEPGIDDSGDANAGIHPASELPSSDLEPAIGDSGDTIADVHSASVIPPSSDRELRIGDSGVTNADKHSLSGLLSFDHEPGIDDSGDTNPDVVADILMKPVSSEIPEKLKEQLYINNFEKELVHLQLHEESDVRKEFEQHRLQWANEKSTFTASIDDLESKNKTLSEELSKCRSELDLFANKMEELDMSVSFSKTELDWSSSRIQELETELSNMSSDLVDSKSLVSDFQAKNETLNVNITSLTKEKEGLVLENEKLVKELMECKSLLESSQVENVNAKESLALIMEERAKLEEAKQKYVSEKDKLLSDWKKLDEVLASEREERSKHKEANEHFIRENNKVSMELLESKKLMESLQSEIAKLNENLDLVTMEKSKLGEDMNNLRFEKDECFTELTDCKSLLKNLQIEYEKSMNESRESALQLEQLTKENVTLISNLDTYKAKVTELDELKMKFEERASHSKLEENNLEEIFLKNVILDEVMKQYVHMVEAKKDDFVILCQDLKQEVVTTKTKNSELTEKLHNSESRIQDLMEKLEDHLKTHYSLSDSYKEMNEKIKDLEQTNEHAAYVIHKVFDNLQKIVNGNTEESEDDTKSGQLDHLEVSNYDMFIERLIMILRERAQLESKNREYILDLIRRIKDLEESNRVYNNPTKDLKIMELQNQVNQLTFSIIPTEIEISIFKESLKSAIEQIVSIQSVTKVRETEFHQSENRVSALREKLHIAVTKGKGLIQQRDNLKQNLSLKDSAIQELETKLKSYSEAGERMEALESELSYIRNSATALRESFLLKDSILQRIEEILEDLDLPEHFHDRDIIEKIDWLAKSVSHGPSQPGMGVIERAHSYPGSGSVDGWKEELELVSDELRRNYEELQNRFYELAEQNEMLEQSLMERNNLVQRCEEVLEKTNMPLHLRSSETEDKIEWLRVVFSEANDRCTLLEQTVTERNNVVQRCEEVLEKTNMPLDLKSSELEHKIDWLRVALSEANDRSALLEKLVAERNNVVQRCEEVLEKTDMPLDLRSSELEQKIDWLCVVLSEANNRYALLEQSLVERNSLVQRCEEVLEKTNMPPDLRSSELEKKIDWLCVVLSEANDRCALLEELLVERNSLVQRCEEVFEKTNMPPDLRSSELEHKIDWLHVSLSEANDRCALLQQDSETYRGSLSADLKEANDRCALLEQLLTERNSLVRRCEEVLEKTNMSSHLQSLELEHKIDWLCVALSEANDRCALLQQDMEKDRGSLSADLKEANDRNALLQQDLEKVRVSLSADLKEANDRCALLQQDLEKVRGSLSADLEQANDRYALLQQELEKVRGSLSADLKEANDHNALLQQDLEKVRGPLSADLKEANDRNALLQQDLEKVRGSLYADLEQANDRYALLQQELEKVRGSLSADLKEANDHNALLQQDLEKVRGPLSADLKEANDRNALLQQDLEKVRGSLSADLEQANDRYALLQQELEKVHGSLSADLKEANDHNALLQQNLEKVRLSLSADLEEANDRCALLQQDLEKVRGSLSADLKEAHDRYALLQQDLEKVRGSLSFDLEESNRRLLDLEANLKSITDERDQILSRFEAQSHDYNKIYEKVGLYEIENRKLQNEIGALQLKLNEKRVDEDHIKRLQNLVKDILQDSETEDFDSSMNDIECLEGLLIKLEEKYPKYHSGERSIDQLEILEKKLEEVEGDLVQVKDERDKHMEKSQSLVNEVEALELKNQELQKLLVQEEQKVGVVREKLNVAVRKGKSLVQQRDSMKQTINELTAEVARLTSEVKVRENTLSDHQEKTKELFKTINELTAEVARLTSEIKVRENTLLEHQEKTKGLFKTINDLTADVARLTSEIKVRESTLLDHQEKMKDLFTLQDLVENKDSEIRFLKNRLEEVLSVLEEIDVGVELKRNDPIEKLEEIEKICRDLQDGKLSAEQDSRKSKRAAELLLEELNEVQDRNEDLLDDISKLSKEKELAEIATRDSLSHLDKLSALHLEERSNQFEELMMLKSGLEQLKPELRKIYNLVNDVLPKDLDRLYNLESSVKSLLNHGGIISRKDSKENLNSRLFMDTKNEEENSDNEIVDLWRFVGTHMEDLITNITLFEEKLQTHSKSLQKEAINLSETFSTFGKQKETENSSLRKFVSMLYEACKNSVYEIEKVKGQHVSDDESFLFIEGETLSVSEERIVSIVNRLLSLVKDFHSFQNENMEVNLKEMKDRVSSLQKELTEKDVQKDRMCVDLVNQIKRAETTAMNNLQELESAKVEINDLKGQLEAVNLDCNALKQRVKEVEEGQESVLVDLQEKVKSLTHALTAKEQEAEALLQALDEEEAQMEELTNKNTELQKQIHQKNLDLETTETSRGKALKKLSITVSKFDELHHLSETLVSEIDNLQSQIQDRDSEISFLRNEITRCTSDSLQALESDKKDFGGIQDILSWLETQDLNIDNNNNNNNNNNDQVHEYKETLKRQITFIVSELKELRQVAQSKDELLNIERSKVDDLLRKKDVLENSMREQESRLSGGDSEIVEVEPLVNKWEPKGTKMSNQVRSLRKVNNDQLAISIDDVDSDEKDKLEDEDDDKAHGFKSLTTSKLVPKFTRPVTNFIDGLWVSCDRALQRQPVLRLSLIIYWALMHVLLAVFVV